MSEIRLRDVAKPLLDQLNKIAAITKTNTHTATIETLINRFLEDQQTTAQLRQSNSELQRQINHYYEKEDDARELLGEFAQICRFNKEEVERMMKKFTRKPKKVRAKAKVKKKKAGTKKRTGTR
jgi:hypothetical protein